MENFKHLLPVRMTMHEYNLTNKLTAEFIGTFFLVLTICTAGVHGLAGIFAPFAIASTLMVMIYALGHVSGAHFNPAVTLGVWLRGACADSEVLPYIGTQVIAGILAAIVSQNALVSDPNPNLLVMDTWQAFTAEFLYTFALVFVILNVATSESNSGNGYFGAAIAFVVLAGALTVGEISGGSFNPAVTSALLTADVLKFEDLWLHIVPQVLAGLMAALVFRSISPVVAIDDD